MKLSELLAGIGVRKVMLLGREFEARLVEGPVQALVEHLHPRPEPPMVQDPTRGLSAPKIPDFEDAEFLAQVAVWEHAHRCLIVGLSIAAVDPEDDAAGRALALLLKTDRTADQTRQAREELDELVDLMRAIPVQDVAVAHIRLVRPFSGEEVEEARKKSSGGSPS